MRKEPCLPVALQQYRWGNRGVCWYDYSGAVRVCTNGTEWELEFCITDNGSHWHRIKRNHNRDTLRAIASRVRALQKEEVR
jgi:hypothetical protein